jgi:hypothetical protein
MTLIDIDMKKIALIIIVFISCSCANKKNSSELPDIVFLGDGKQMSYIYKNLLLSSSTVNQDHQKNEVVVERAEGKNKKQYKEKDFDGTGTKIVITGDKISILDSNRNRITLELKKVGKEKKLTYKQLTTSDNLKIEEDKLEDETKKKHLSYYKIKTMP